jgi:hypothetical protein
LASGTGDGDRDRSFHWGANLWDSMSEVNWRIQRLEKSLSRDTQVPREFYPRAMRGSLRKVNAV